MEAKPMTPSIVKNVVRMPKERTKRVRSRISYMNETQQERFLRAAKEYGPREYAMFLFALAHAARAQEICNLRMGDVDFKNGQIRVIRVKGSLDTTQSLLRVKGDSLFNETQALKDWLAVRPPDAGDFVFNTQKSIQIDRITVYKLFRKIAAKADLPENLRHPHCLKHTCIMNLVSKGVDAFQIKQYAGHKAFDSTLAYVHGSDSTASAAAGKAFAQIFG
jgi:integrase/recombinase XerD